MKYAIMIVILIASTARADFEGWPWADATNAEGSNIVYWADLIDLYNPPSQYVGAVTERVFFRNTNSDYWGTFPPTDLGTLSLSQSVPAGYSNGIPDGTYSVSSNFVWDWIPTPASNSLGPYEYQYYDYISSTVVAATTHPPLTIALLNYCDDVMGYASTDPDYIAVPIWGFMFLATNQAVGGTYNNWFAQQHGDGGFLQNLPRESKVGLFHRNDIGYTYTIGVGTNEWGFITGRFSDEFGEYQSIANNAWYTSQPPSIDLVLAEFHFTGAWHTAYSCVGTRNMTNPVALPILRYRSNTTNPITPIQFYFSGRKLSPASGTLPMSTSAHPQDWPSGNETVTVTSTNTSLTVPWWRVDWFAHISGNSYFGDSMELVYTNTASLYTKSMWYPCARTLDEMAEPFQFLIWTGSDPPDSESPPHVAETSWTANDTNNYRLWAGGSTSSWTAAKAIASTNVSVGTNDLGPLSGSYGTATFVPSNVWLSIPAHTSYYAQAEARSASCVVSRVPYTNVTATPDWYVRAQAYHADDNTVTVFHSAGVADIYNAQYRVWQQDTAVALSSVTSSVALGNTTFPPNVTGGWCATPTTNAPTARGFQVDNQRCIQKWNFQYK